MKNIWAVTLLSYKEGLRHRVLYGVLIFALLIMAFSVLVSGLFMRDISKVMLDFCLSAVTVGGLLVPFFLAINLLARDIERKTIFSVLSRAISRNEYILGKFGGITLLTGTIMGLLSLAVLLAIWGSQHLYADYFFTRLSWPAVFIAVGISFLGVLVLNACVVLWSSITTSSFLATLLTLFTYLIGQTVEDMVRFMSVPTPGTEFSPALKAVVRGALYVFPDLAAFDLKLQAAHGIFPSVREILLLTGYAAAYSAVVLIIAMLIFRRRDLS